MSAGSTRRLFVPGLVAAFMFATLIGLGVWQLQRRVWKTAMLDQIDRAEAAPAIPLPADPLQFAKVRVDGRFESGLEARYGADVRDLPGGPVFGTQVITPLDRPGADPVLVDRGWAPLGQTLPPGAGSVDGYIRTPDAPGLFSAHDDPAKRQFYTLDPKAIGASLGLPRVAPFTLVALGAVVPGVFPQPATELPRPPNDHLNYALTWFGLALSLVVVFAVYTRKTLRP